MPVNIKTLDALTKEDINTVISNSRTYGFMKYLMKNLKNRTIESPEKLKLFYHKDFSAISSWLLLDDAKELCKTLIDDELSVMLYTAYKYRNKGLMNGLIVAAKPELKNKILKVYADPWELDYIYIQKLAKKHELIFQSHTTSYDLKAVPSIC